MRTAYRHSTRRWLLLQAAVLILVLSGLAAGCSSSKPAYCTDADQLKTSVQNLGNVDVAKNGLDSLKTALSSVRTSANAFATDAKSEFAPQTTALKNSLSSLDTAIKSVVGQPSAATVAAIGPAVSQVKTSASDLENAASGKCK
jgi:hypothetical protein